MDSDPAADAVGPNAWLVDEMYEQYLADPSSVGRSWHEFFADYRPAGALPRGGDPIASRRTRSTGFADRAHHPDPSRRPGNPR